MPYLVRLVMRHGRCLIIVILITLAFPPGIQTAGANKIFSSSKEKHGRYYTSFYGHSDSKACPAVKDIYGPTKLI